MVILLQKIIKLIVTWLLIQQWIVNNYVIIIVDIYQVQSVIQPNHQSVIQSATNIQPVAISKGNVILVSKPNSVIQSAQGSLQALQVIYL